MARCTSMVFVAFLRSLAAALKKQSSFSPTYRSVNVTVSTFAGAQVGKPFFGAPKRSSSGSLAVTFLSPPVKHYLTLAGENSFVRLSEGA